MAKTQPTEVIRSIKKGERDSSGNQIVSVLAAGNEYAIYEIEAAEPENRLRFQIDGITDSSEKVLRDKFAIVRQKYVLAKGLLYRASNYNLMKNRVAHALAGVFSGNQNNPTDIFDDLIEEIKKEYASMIWKKVIYLMPGYVLLILLAANFLYELYHENYLSNIYVTELLRFVTCTSIGSVFSVTYSVRKVLFESEPNIAYYFVIGCERFALAILSGIIFYVAIKSRVLFGDVITSNTFASLFVGFAAGFTERFVPNLMKKGLEDAVKPQGDNSH
jgi:hypothetical protein